LEVVDEDWPNFFEVVELSEDQDAYTGEHHEHQDPDHHEFNQVDGHVLQSLKHWPKLLRYAHFQKQFKPGI